MSDAASAPIRIADLQDGQRLDGAILLLTHRELRTSRSGSMYIDATLCDSSGNIRARMWDASPELLDSLPAGGLIAVRGRIESYQRRLQLILEGVQAVDAADLDPSAYLPGCREPVGPMWERVKEILRTIRHGDLLRLVGKFVNDEAFARNFQRAPAARSLHHAYVGGLLEHTRNLLELALVVLPRYPRVNADLVLAGVFLHDAAKTAELECGVGFEYTVEGALVGHIVQCVAWIDQHAAALERELGRPLDPEALVQLRHIIVAHHGQLEFGSPKLPATAEAVLVHYLDNIDAKMNMIDAALEADADPDSPFTAWISALGTRLYKGRR